MFSFQQAAIVRVAALVLEARTYPEGSYYRSQLLARANAWREIAFADSDFSGVAS